MLLVRRHVAQAAACRAHCRLLSLAPSMAAASQQRRRTPLGSRGSILWRRRAAASLHSCAPRHGKVLPFVLADIGEGIKEVEVLQWHVAEVSTARLRITKSALRRTAPHRAPLPKLARCVDGRGTPSTSSTPCARCRATRRPSRSRAGTRGTLRSFTTRPETWRRLVSLYATSNWKARTVVTKMRHRLRSRRRLRYRRRPHPWPQSPRRRRSWLL